MFSYFSDIKATVAGAIDGISDTLFGTDPDTDPFGNAGVVASSEDVFATAQAMQADKRGPVKGTGYDISFVHHKNRAAHERPYFFASPLGAPFPSYHSNPMPNFPARWTQIPGVVTPCETLLAPRVRLAPKELDQERRDALDKMRCTATAERGEQLAELESLNLGYQALGDPYQYEAFVTFMDLNRNVKVLNLTDNELEDITDLDLTSVVRLHLSNNNFVSFEALPPLPNCEELYLTENFVSGLRGLKKENMPKLRVLNVHHNPVALLTGYRKKLKRILPSLEYVDGLRTLDADDTLLEMVQNLLD